MACKVLQKEVTIAHGFKHQVNLATPQAVTDMWRLQWLDPIPIEPEFSREDDSDDNTGTGSDFATRTYPISRIARQSLSGQLSVHKMVWAFGFGLGVVGKTGVGPYQYTITPMDQAVDGCELFYFSVLSQVRAGAGTLHDDRYRGMAINGVEVTINSGPGRDSARIAINMIGIGVRDPDTDSGLVMPAETAESFLKGASLTMSSLTVDLVAAQRIKSLTYGFQNNVDESDMFFPGSGQDANGFAQGGRIRYDKRTATLRYVVDLDEAGSEMASQLAGTTGTVVIGQAIGAENYSATFHQVQFLTVGPPTANGRYLQREIVCSVQKHATNGLMTIVANTAFNDIMSASV